ncbi:D-ribose pyranase [Micrococcales bacterium 31B]|nr:D-ribose pyranase [Micrococcales bacterium 31B]
MRNHPGLLHARLAGIVSELGHTQTLTIADAGLPVPASAERVDLALAEGVPSFLQTLDVLLDELCVEAATLAHEMQTVSPELHAEVTRRLAARNIEVSYVSHAEFKDRTALSRAVVRTGDFTPYANVIVHAGVTF